MNYILDWVTSNTVEQLPNKDQIVLTPNQVDNRQSTSLVLFGKGAPNYGEGQQENFLRLLENFASPTNTPPDNPTIGQLWYRSDTYQLMICVALNGNPNDWMPIAVWIGETAPTTPFIGQLWFKNSTNNLWIYGDDGIWVPLDNRMMIPVAYNWEYNNLVNLYNTIVGTNVAGSDCSNSYGWGQISLILANKYLPTDPVTNIDWVALLNNWKDIAPIVGVDPNKFNSKGFIIDEPLIVGNTTDAPGANGNEGKGIVTVTEEYELAKSGAAEIFANRFNFNPLYTELQTFAPINRTSFWSGTTYLNIEFQWSSLNEMNNFFLTGGFIKFIPTFNQQVVDKTSTMWKSFIDSLAGGIFIRGCGTYDTIVNSDSSLFVSYFELPDSISPWPNNAPPNSIGKVLYKAHEVWTPTDIGIGGYAEYPMGTDNDLGWADITIEARKKSPENKLQLRITFQNET